MSLLPDSQETLSCDNCGASIYREHINHNLAARWAGQLLCPHCLNERRQSDPALAQMSTAGESTSKGSGSAGQAAMQKSGFGMQVADPEMQNYKRLLDPDMVSANRLRIFHCKLSEGPVMNLNQQVNEWLDLHPEVRVKFAQQSIGTWEGKHSESHLILTLFY